MNTFRKSGSAAGWLRNPANLATAAGALFPAFLLAAMLGGGCVQSQPSGGVKTSPTVQLTREGQAALPVVVSSEASAEMRAMAAVLADYLGRMGGATFSIETGDGAAGIVVGVASNFPALAGDLVVAADDPLRRETYILRSHENGLYLIGATDLAVQDAVWDLLGRLGYRQFFPGKTWEIIPPPRDLAIAVDALERPDFHTRRIWYGHGMWGYNNQPYADWCARNRADRGFALQTSHMYQAVISRRRAEFEAHPEYMALIGGERKGSKFCISNPGLRKLVTDHVLESLRDKPGTDCVSLEPSDGGGWCECGDCAAIGSISDRVLTLANEVARAVREASPGTHVGFLAYNQHSPPPAIEVETNVIVKVQTAFIRGGYTVDELMLGWQKRGASIGVGDYYSVFLWDNSRPARAGGSDLANIRESIPRFYRQGARFFMAESSDFWGGIGLGHYLAARLLWDVDAADRADEIVDDFLERSFGPAREPMEHFYRRIYRFNEDARRPLIRSDMLARMYRDLDEARRLAGNDTAILARIDDLILFARYEDLFQVYEAASGVARQTALEALLRHAWRMRGTMMVHAKPVIVHLAKRDKAVKEPPREAYADETPFSEEEKLDFLAAGIATYQPVEVGFAPATFSENLVPATPLNLVSQEDGNYNNGAPMGRQIFYTWRDDGAPEEFRLRVSGGHILHYRNIATPVQISLFAEANPLLDEAVAFDDSVAPDGVERNIRLRSAFPGLHRIQVVPPSNRAMVDAADEKMHLTIPSGLDTYNQLSSSWSLYFYVPRGTTVVGGYASGKNSGRILDGNGEARFDFSKQQMPSFFAVPVPEGQDGKLWKLADCTGRRALMTVPPFVARHAAALLLPREVVARDSAARKEEP